MENLSDEDKLALLAKEGDSEAFNTLLTTYRPLVLSYVAKTFPSFDVEEIAQEIIIAMWHEMHKYSPEHKFVSWLFLMMKFRGIDCMRKVVRRSQYTEEHVEDIRDVMYLPHEDHGAFSNETWKLVNECMADLPPLQSRVLRLVADGHSQRKIAAMTFTSLGTVKTRIELGIKRVKKALEAKGHTYDISRDKAG